MEINKITGIIVDAAMKVHSTLGPGLLEQPYQVCLAHELCKKDLQVQSELTLPVVYDGVRIDIGYRVDLSVQNTVIVELKAVSAIAPIHKAQLLSYLKLSRKPIGLLFNFNVLHLKDGIIRLAN